MLNQFRGSTFQLIWLNSDFFGFFWKGFEISSPTALATIDYKSVKDP